jgi:serine/threonine protein kinase/Tfp pilus assembly protein PilF
MIGKIIFHYKILEKLGEGGMGVVYKAQDTKLDRIVALKFLSSGLMGESSAKARLIQEAKTAAGLNHPNICTIYAIEEQEGECFIAMECVEGESLKSLLEKGPLDTNKVFDWISQTAEGVLEAHKKGIIHRDIKSENLVLTKDGRVKIMDFGLAMFKEEKVEESSGTPAYMSPEQVKGEEIDLRTDIFSLGVVFYELLTSQLPFQGFYYHDTVFSILNEEPEPIRKYREDASEELVKIVSKMLAKEKGDRYQDCSELLIELKNLKANLQLGIEEVKEKGVKSIAVLPFEDWSPNKDSEYFSFNMIEDIIIRLSKVKKLKVTPFTLVREYRGRASDLRKIGRELGVDIVLEGRVYKHNSKLKITAELVSIADGYQLWSDKFEGKLENVFDFQEKTAKKIVQRLKVKLTKKADENMGKRSTPSIQAYDFYLKGREYYWREGKENINFAIQMYQKALETDPNYALAYAGLGDAYVNMYMGWFDRDTSWLNKAEDTCKRALSLDKDLPEARRALGRVYFEKKMPEKGIKECKTAIELRPEYFEAYRTLGWIYSDLGKCDEAIKWALNALKHSRWTDKESYLLLGIAYLDKKELGQAFSMFEEAIKLAPDYGRAHYFLGNIQQKRGEFKEALKNYEKAKGLAAGLETQNICLDSGWIFLLKKEYKNAIECFEKVLNLGDLDFIALYYIGFTFERKQQKEQTELYYKKCLVRIKERLSVDPENGYLHSFLGLASTRLGSLEEGLEQAQKGVELDPENGEILYNLARIYAHQNKPKEALSILKTALSKCVSPSLVEVKSDPHFENIKELIATLE